MRLPGAYNVIPTLATNVIWVLLAGWVGLIIGLFYLEEGFSAPPGPPDYGIVPGHETFVGSAGDKVTERVDRRLGEARNSLPSVIGDDTRHVADARYTPENRASPTGDIGADIALRFNEARDRLRTQILDLNRRGNLNLLIGIVISLAGMAVLGIYIFTEDFSPFSHSYYGSSSPDYVAMLAKKVEFYAVTFLPRLTFVLVMELFAYFFLRLYKASLSEVKYFQNEITNIEAKHFALRVALESKAPPTLLTKVVTSLVETERNHILEKGQTTVDLELAKNERQGITDALKDVTTAVDKLTKKSGKA